MFIEKLKYRYRSLRYRYLLDRNEIDFIVKSVNTGDICVDIGCHKGGYLYWLQKKVGQNGKIYAFEPQIRLYNYLQEILNINHYDNVVLECKGISDHQGVSDFYIPRSKNGTSPGARINASGNSIDYKKIMIELVTLDQYFLENKIFPNLLKIDVEGHEKQVLLGGLELLKFCKPKILIECEYRHLKEGEDVFDVFKILTQIGYSGYFFSGNKSQPVSEFNKHIHQKSDVENFWDKKEYINNFIFVASNS
jgi:FkbM family methyltransferase